MKNLRLVVLSVFSFFLLNGQAKGKVTYRVSADKSSIELPYENPENNEARNKALETIHESQPVDAYLIFNDSIGMYYVQPKSEIPEWNNTDGFISITPSDINIIWLMAGGDNVFYTDWSRSYNIKTFNAMGQTNRIIKDVKTWDITDETKVILGYNCKKAISKKNTRHVAWFTEAIPVKHGPNGAHGLDGLVLEFLSHKFSYAAIKVELNHPEVADITEPKNGELISYDKFKKKHGHLLKPD